MRAASFVLMAGLLLTLGIPATAQQSASNMFTGVNPRNINLVKIDTDKAMRNLNVNNAFRTPAPAKSFSLGSIFPKVHLGSWPPVVAAPSVLSQKNNPFQPNPIFGKNPFAP